MHHRLVEENRVLKKQLWWSSEEALRRHLVLLGSASDLDREDRVSACRYGASDRADAARRSVDWYALVELYLKSSVGS